jgi:hypothetical protein
MTQQIIDIGIQGNDGTGDSIRTSFEKVNSNFTEIYAIFGAGGSIGFGQLADAPGTTAYLTTTASGNGTNVTMNFTNGAPQLGIPFSIGQNIVISGVIPASYNGTQTVLNSTTTSVTFASTVTAPITQTGKIAGTPYSANQIIMGSTTGSSLSARNLVEGDGITIDASSNSQIVITANAAGLVSDPTPTMGSPINANLFTIGRLGDPSSNLVDTFNAVYARSGVQTTLGQLAVTVNYANNHYLQVVNGQVTGPLRVREMPTIAQTNEPDYDSTLSGNYTAQEAVQRKHVVLRDGDNMTGALTLSDHPGDMKGFGVRNGQDDLQAATKFYVDNSTYYSNVNLYVSTGGDDTQKNTPAGREGRSPRYAYKTLGAAALQADNLINLAFGEPGPYRQTIAYTIGPNQYQSSILSVSFSGGNSSIQGYLDAASLLEANKSFIQNETISYLNQKYVNTFTFDKTRYANIMLDIVNGVGYDLLIGSNFNSVTQASKLFDSYNSDVIGNLTTIVAAIQNAESQILNYAYSTTDLQTYLGTVIDAVCYDLLLGSNYKSIQVALAFPYANTGLETTATIINTEVTATSGVATGTQSYIAGTVLTVGGTVTGQFAVGMTVTGFGVTAGTTITGLLTGSGVAGTYTVSINQTAGSLAAPVSVTGTNNTITVDSTKSMVVGTAITFAGTSFGNLIAGNTYYIKSIINSTTLTVSQTLNGTTYGLTTATGMMEANTTAPSGIASTLLNLAADINAIPAVAAVPSATTTITTILTNISNIIVTNVLPTPTFPPVSQSTGFTYDSVKCSRDVGLIVNAVLDDLIFGTNYRTLTAAFAYLRSYSSVVTTAQKSQTIAGLNYARDQVIALLSDSVAITSITNSMNVVTAIINAVSTSGAPALTFSNPTGSTLGGALSGVTNGAAELIANRQFLIDEVIAYINANLTPGSIPLYDEAVCRRDTGYLIDAMTFDLLYGGNTATIIAADAYYNGGGASTISQETAQVAAAFTRLQNIIGFVVQGSTAWVKSVGNTTIQSTTAGAGSSNAAVQVSTLVGYVIAVVNNGLASNPTSVAPSYIYGVNYSKNSSRTTVLSGLSTIQANVIAFLNETYVSSSGETAAISLLLNNINFIQTEIIAYLQANYPTLTFSKTTCQRDVKYIIWALCYDSIYGGNSASIYAGLQYWLNSKLQIASYEQSATVAAIGYINTLAQAIITNNPPATLYQTGVIQYANITLAGGAVASTSINSNIASIQSIVGSISKPNPSSTYPVITGVSSTLTGIVGSFVSPAAGTIQYSKTALGASAVTYVNNNFPVLNDPTQQATVTSLFNNILNLVNQGISSRTTPTFTNPSGLAASNVAAQSAILANIGYITAEINAYMTNAYPNVPYSTGQSIRDVTYVLEAFAYDITYGGNSATVQAANQYYANGVAQLLPSHKDVCLAGMAHLGNVVRDVISNSASSPAPGNFIATLTASGTGGAGGTATLTFSNQGSAPYTNGQVITVQGMAPTSYNGYWTVTNCTATSVSFTSSASGSQTVAGKITKQVGNVSWLAGSGQTTTITTLLALVTGVVNTGNQIAVANTVYPITSNYSVGLQGTFTIIQNNAVTISNAVISYLSTAFAGGFSYNQATCFRDIGYIIEGQIIDLLTDGTYQTITAGKSYYKNVSAKSIAIGAQYSETVDGIQFAQQLAIQVLNQTTQTRYQTLVIQQTNATLGQSYNATIGTNVATATFASNTTTTLTVTGVSGTLVPGMVISGSGFTNVTPVTITNVLSTTQVTLSAAPAGTISGGATLTFTATPITELNANMNTIVSIIANGIGAAPQTSFGTGYYTITFGNGGNGSVDQGQSGSNHIIPGKVLVGVNSSAYGQIVSYAPGVSTNFDTITLNMTRPGFFNVVPTQVTGTIGQTSLVVASTTYTIPFNGVSKISIGMGVYGAGIATGTFVTGVTGNTVTLNLALLSNLTNSNATFGEKLDFGETVADLNIKIFIESGIYLEDYPIKIPANVSIFGDDFRRTIIRPLDRVSQSPWRTTFFYRDAIIDGMQLGLIDYTSDYATIAATTLSINGTTGSITATLGSGQASPSWIGKVIVDATSETGTAGKAIVNTVSGNVMNCTVVYPFSTVTTYASGSWHLYGTYNYGRHYLTNPLDITSTPKNNKLMDVFLCNDATRIKLISCQGHGGFMMVLDPTGQIKTKSPYAQESASFSGSINRQRFAGGQFIDGFAGRLKGTITSITNTGATITVTGALNSGLDVRAPQTPCAFYVSGTRYQINNVLSYNSATYTAVLGLDTATPFYPSSTYGNSLLTTNLSGGTITVNAASVTAPSLVDAVNLDMAFGSNYQSVKYGIVFLQPANAVVGVPRTLVTQAFTYVASQVSALGNVSAGGVTSVASNVNIINNIINNGIYGNPSAGIPTLTFPNPTNVTANTGYAKTLLQANRAFIQAEITARLAVNYNVASYSTYSATTMSNNIGFAIDALTYDFLYGGTSASYDVAQWCYNSTIVTLNVAAMGYLSTIIGQVVQKTTVTKSAGNVLSQNTTGTAATSTEATALQTLCAIFTDYVTDGVFTSSTRTNPTVSSSNTSSTLSTNYSNISSAKTTISTNTITYVNNGAGININMEMGGNKSMLANDYTQINDLGYGILCTNAGLTEQVSTFTYYCYTAYWALNGGQIRSVAGSNSNGVYGLRGTGSDVTELPDSVNLSYNMMQSARVYKQGAFISTMTPTATTKALDVYITSWEYIPPGTTEMEIDHTLAGGGITRYLVNTVTHTNVTVNGQNVLQLTLSTSGTENTATGGLAYPLYDGQLIALRVLQNILFYNIDNVKPVRPSTALQYTNNLATIYRIIAYNLVQSTGEQLPANQSLLQFDSSFVYYKFVVDTTNMLNADPTVTTATANVALTPASSGTTLYVITSSIVGSIASGQYVGGYGFQNIKVVGSPTISGSNTVITLSGTPAITPVGSVYFATSTQGGNVGDNKIAVLQISDAATVSQMNTGTYLFAWNGRTHRVVQYVQPTSVGTGLYTNYTAVSTVYTLTVQNFAGSISAGQIVTGTGFNGTQKVVTYTLSVLPGTTNTQAVIILDSPATTTPSGAIVFGGASVNGYLQLDSNPVSNIGAYGTGVNGLTYLSDALATGSTVSKIVTYQIPFNPIYAYPPVDSYLTIANNTNTNYNGNYLVTALSNTSQITVADTSNLKVGMVITTNAAGAFVEGATTNPSGSTIIQSIDSSTAFTVSPGTWLPPSTSITAILVASVSSITITNSGSGYVTAPTIKFSGGGLADNSNSHALATCTIDSFGSISSVTRVSPGSGYTSTPTITLSGNSGTVASTVSGTNLITLNSTANLQTGAVITFGGTTFGNLQTLTNYYIASIIGNKITVSGSNTLTPIFTLADASGSTMTWSTPGTAVLTPVLSSSPQVVTTTSSSTNTLNMSVLYPTDPGTTGNATATSSPSTITLSTVTNVSIGNKIIFSGTAFGGIATAVVTAGAFVIGQSYTIVSGAGINAASSTTNYTDFTSIGAANNNVGTTFKATGIGSGVGTASPTFYIVTLASSNITIAHTKGGAALTSITTSSSATTTFYTPSFGSINQDITPSAIGAPSLTASQTINGTVYTNYYNVAFTITSTSITAGTYYRVTGNTNSLYNGYWLTANSTGSSTTLTLIFPYSPGTAGAAATTVIAKEITNATSSSLGISKPFNASTSTTLRMGYPATQTGQVTVRISTCRATGHDFLDIGTGGFVTTNYPNQIYGNAAIAANSSNQVVEETVGRVFHVSTDENGIFRVGRFFKVDQGTGTVTFSASIALSNLDGLGFKRGVVVSEFSTDANMTQNAPDTVPTQSAIRSFIDYRLGLDYGGSPVASTNLIGPGYLPLNGSLAMKGNLNMAGYTIGNLFMPTSSITPYDGVNRGYVDSSSSGINNLYKLNDIAVRATGTYVGFAASGGLPTVYTLSLNSVFGSIIPGMILQSGSGYTGGQTVLSVTLTPGLFPAGASGTVTLSGNLTGASGTLTFTNYTGGDFLVYDSTISQWTNISPPSNVTPSGSPAGSHIGFTFTHGTPGTLVTTIQSSAIVNSMVNTNAAIAQSKLALQAAGTLATAPGVYTQSSLGLAVFNDKVFTTSQGWVDLLDSTSSTTGIALAKLRQMSSGYLLGNRSGVPAVPGLITPANVVTDGDGMKNALFSTDNTVTTDASAKIMLMKYDGSNTSNNTYGVIGVTTTGAASKIVKTGTAGEIDTPQLKINSNKTIDSSGSTLSLYTPGLFKFLGAADVAGSATTTISGLLNATIQSTSIQSGATTTDVSTVGSLYGSWALGANAIFNFNNGTLQTTNITSGGATTAGTLTGLWSIDGKLRRTAPGKGYLDGNYPSVETTSSSGAIYSIGGTYVPGSADLGNMYGIGFGYSGSAGAIKNPGGVADSKWGLYVASSGTARIFLNSDDGSGHFGGAVNTATLNGTGAGTYGSGTINGAWSLGSNATITATYAADLAEYYEGDKTYEVGTVLVFGGDKEVTTTDTINDTRLAGIVSDNAAYIMYDACPGEKNLIALAGRVSCKVVGRVKKGDMLTTSATHGYAVKALNPTLGSIVGKALEDKDYGEAGVIQVAVGRA